MNVPRFSAAPEAALSVPSVGTRLVAQGALFPHPAAASAFRAFAGLGFACPVHPTLLPPVLAIRQQHRFWMVGGFASRLAHSQADQVPLRVIAPVPDDHIQALAWGEIAQTLGLQFAPGAGTAKLIAALELMPAAIRSSHLGALSDSQILRLLGRRSSALTRKGGRA